MATASKEEMREFPEESVQTRKAREKVRRQMELLEKKVTPEALNKKKIEIHRWIERHARGRITLKNKSISLFDENQNAVSLSKRISQLAGQLINEKN